LGGSKRQAILVVPALPSNSPTVAYTLPTFSLIVCRSPRTLDVEPPGWAIVHRASDTSLSRTLNFARRSVLLRPSKMPSGLALSATT
jgi:hypothetical protein